MADIKGLLESLAEELGAEYQPGEDETWEVTVSADEDFEVPLTIYLDTLDDGPAQGRQFILIRTTAGPYADGIETFLLEDAGEAWLARVYLEVDDEAGELLVVEAGLPAAGADAALFAHAVLEVVDLAVLAQGGVVLAEE